MKDMTLASTRATLSSTQTSFFVVQIDSKTLHLENALLAHRLTECPSAGVSSISDSFKNTLKQVEHFHILLHFFRDHI